MALAPIELVPTNWRKVITGVFCHTFLDSHRVDTNSAEMYYLK